MASSGLGYLSIKKQSTAETAVKPTNFIRFREGGLTKKIVNVKNSPIQNNRYKNLSIKRVTEDCEGTIQADFDFNESVWFFYGALGTLTPTDISSATDASVTRHVITFTNQLPSFSIEQCQGDASDTTSNKQRFLTKRGFGAKLDSFSMKATDSDVITMDVTYKMLGIFEKADLLADRAAGSSVTVYLDNIAGLVATSDTITMYDETPQDESDAIASLSASANTITIATLSASFTVANKAKIELAPQSPSYAVEPEHAALPDCNIQFGDTISAAGAAAEINIDEWELKFMNNVLVKKGTKLGRADEQRSSGQFVFKKFFDTKEERDDYQRNAKKAIIITITNNKVISATDTNLYKYQLELKCPNVRYDEFDIPTGNDMIFEIEATCEIFYDVTEAYALKATFQNAKIGTYFTS